MSLPLPLLTIIRHKLTKSGCLKPLTAESLNDSNGNNPCEFSCHDRGVWPGARVRNPSYPKSGTIIKVRNKACFQHIPSDVVLVSARSVPKRIIYLGGVGQPAAKNGIL
jgi:hypothetical protein